MIKETLERVKKPTPDYFKKVINIGITLGVIGTTAGIIAAAVAKTTVDK
jgi:hypothetical protein